MPLLKRPLPFDDPDWLFELKYDGFRALAVRTERLLDRKQELRRLLARTPADSRLKYTEY